MAPSSKRIPKHWKLVTQKQNGSKISVYKCKATGQKFYKYEDMMRYINYAKDAKLGIYDPNFGKQFWPPKKKGGRPKKGDRSVVGESGMEREKSAVTDTDLEIPQISSSELAPAAEKGVAVVVDEHSGTEDDPGRHMETDGSSTEEDKRYRKKYVRRNKSKKLQ